MLPSTQIANVAPETNFGQHVLPTGQTPAAQAAAPDGR